LDSYLFQGRREQELRAVPKWRKYWKLIQRKDTPEMREKLDWERRFLQRLMIKFMKLLESVEVEGWHLLCYNILYLSKYHMHLFYKTFT
jgi:intron-binding protein aquarius